VERDEVVENSSVKAPEPMRSGGDSYEVTKPSEHASKEHTSAMSTELLRRPTRRIG